MIIFLCGIKKTSNFGVFFLKNKSIIPTIHFKKIVVKVGFFL